MATTTVRLTKSFLRKSQAPGVTVARARGAEALGVAYADTTATISRQATDGAWIEWSVTA